MSRRDLIGAGIAPSKPCPPGVRFKPGEGTKIMIVLGADMHKASHTLAAVGAATGEMLGDKTVAVGSGGFAAALTWARECGPQRVWALEDCRHVSGSFERFLLEHGERVVRVATKLWRASDAALGIAASPI